MSLVAYASSDEESEEETEAPVATRRQSLQTASLVQPAAASPTAAAAHISDEDDDYSLPTQATSTAGLSLPAPQHRTQTTQLGQAESAGGSNNRALLSTLPAPSVKSRGAAQPEHELEDFVKRAAPSTQAQPSAPRPQPTAPKRKLIAAPSLVDSDEDEPQSKRQLPAPRPQGKKSGLFSVLPAPKNSLLGGGKVKQDSSEMFDNMFSKAKERKPAALPTQSPVLQAADSHPPKPKAKFTSNFVPTSLTRKPQQSSRSAFNLETGMMMTRRVKKTEKSVNSGELQDTTERDAGGKACDLPEEAGSSDDEAADTNFFSLAPDTSSAQPPLPGPSASDAGAGTPTSESQDQPLSFRASSSHAMAQLATARHPHGAGGHHFASSSSSSQAAASQQDNPGHLYSNAYYNMVDSELAPSEPQDDAEPSSPPDQSVAFNTEFLRMQGKSNRGKEAVSFIDVHQDDQVREVDMNLVKSLSEENAGRQSHSKKKNQDMPTSQQRRKHQINYLAFKAKEREVELKDAWAANRQTKRQTQAKYGF